MEVKIFVEDRKILTESAFRNISVRRRFNFWWIKNFKSFCFLFPAILFEPVLNKQSYHCFSQLRYCIAKIRYKLNYIKLYTYVDSYDFNSVQLSLLHILNPHFHLCRLTLYIFVFDTFLINLCC